MAFVYFFVHAHNVKTTKCIYTKCIYICTCWCMFFVYIKPLYSLIFEFSNQQHCHLPFYFVTLQNHRTNIFIFRKVHDRTYSKSKGHACNFLEKGQKMARKNLKIWARMDKIWKYFEKGRSHVSNYRMNETAIICTTRWIYIIDLFSITLIYFSFSTCFIFLIFIFLKCCLTHCLLKFKPFLLTFRSDIF